MQCLVRVTTLRVTMTLPAWRPRKAESVCVPTSSTVINAIWKVSTSPRFDSPPTPVNALRPTLVGRSRLSRRLALLLQSPIAAMDLRVAMVVHVSRIRKDTSVYVRGSSTAAGAKRRVSTSRPTHILHWPIAARLFGCFSTNLCKLICRVTQFWKSLIALISFEVLNCYCSDHSKLSCRLTKVF